MELKDILESILFSSLKPLSTKELSDILKQAAEGDAAIAAHAKAKAAKLTAALEELDGEVAGLDRSYRLV